MERVVQENNDGNLNYASGFAGEINEEEILKNVYGFT